MGKRVDWSHLPNELWSVIAKYVYDSIDVLRFRSVCKTWRSSLPLPPSLTLFTLQIPIPHAQDSLHQTKLYTLQPLLSSSSSFNSKAFLVKVGHSKVREIHLLDPFTNGRLSDGMTEPKFLNSLNFRIIEFFEAYTLRTDADMPLSPIRKVILFPGFHVQDRMLFAVFKDGKLGFSKIGDQNWIILNNGNHLHDDIILHKAQLYVVDTWGIIFWIDCSSFKLVQFSPLLFGFGKRKHLVESAGSFYVVDMYMEGDVDSQVVDIKLYKLDEEWGRWVDVRNLGHVLFVLCGDTNFSLSSQDYYGCEGNCIYFYSAGKASAFCLRNSKFKTPNPFCPCPSLFHPKFNFEV